MGGGDSVLFSLISDRWTNLFKPKSSIYYISLILLSFYTLLCMVIRYTSNVLFHALNRFPQSTVPNRPTTSINDINQTNSIPSRQSLTNSIKQLLVIAIPTTGHKDISFRLNCAIQIGNIAREFIGHCETLFPGNLFSRRDSLSLCLSYVWRDFLGIASLPRILSTQNDKNSLSAIVCDCDARPLLIRQKSASLFLPLFRLWDIWETTLNIEMKRIFKSFQPYRIMQFESSIESLVSLLPNSLEWTFLVCARLLNHSIISGINEASCGYLKLLTESIIQLSYKLRKQICRGSSTPFKEQWALGILSDSLLRYKMRDESNSLEDQTLDSNDSNVHPSGKHEYDSGKLRNEEIQRIVKRLIGRASGRHTTDVMNLIERLTRIVQSSITLPRAKNWDMWMSKYNIYILMG